MGVIFMNNAWRGFKKDLWDKEINVKNFIENNYKSYDGD